VYTRKLYLDRIRPYLDKPVVKVLSGMRRVGKLPDAPELQRLEAQIVRMLDVKT